VPWSDAAPPVADIWTALTGIAATPDEPAPSPSPAIAPLTSTLASTHLSDAASIATGTTTTRRAGGSLRPKIKPHQATVLPPATDSSALYSLEKRTSAIVAALRSFALAHPSAEAALAQSPSAAGIAIAVPEAEAPVFIPAHVATAGSTDELAGAGGILALPRLQRLRRQWISLNRSYVGANHSSNRGSLAPEQVPDAFVRFLNADFAGGSR
jgi:protein KTI12